MFSFLYILVPDHEFAAMPNIPATHQQQDNQPGGLHISGSSSHMATKPVAQKPQMSSQAKGKPVKKKVVTKQQKRQIRNWNERDDDGEENR